MYQSARRYPFCDGCDDCDGNFDSIVAFSIVVTTGHNTRAKCPLHRGGSPLTDRHRVAITKDIRAFADADVDTFILRIAVEHRRELFVGHGVVRCV